MENNRQQIPFKVEVDCYNGYRGEETPRRFRLGGRSVEVREVLDRWLAPEHRYFKVIGEDDAVYILRHDVERDLWQVTLYTKQSDISFPP